MIMKRTNMHELPPLLDHPSLPPTCALAAGLHREPARSNWAKYPGEGYSNAEQVKIPVGLQNKSTKRGEVAWVHMHHGDRTPRTQPNAWRRRRELRARCEGNQCG